ncbi:Signal transduction histidine kinase [Streptomyces zhaozhouensis]|uniref:histidine kinase n=1 Tax=Streptomyces zhaozhouensis TaxID=1300267 RepID=A0A286E6U0_9ACTN|nr:sensor histidine kinase [Streptomyces zhaozhouensis]SOD66616.1 Signal transduction histidine kinase [Streptomyces zhaozhouensis]
MRERTAWAALARRPLRFLATPWPWRALLYTATGVVFGALAAAVLLTLAVAGLATVVVGVGAPLLLAVALSGVFVTRVERWRLRLVDRDPVPDPHRAPPRPGARAWVAARLREPATWRELGFTAVSLTALWWLDLLVLGFALGLPALLAHSPVDDPSAWPWLVVGVALLPAAPYTLTAWAGARAALTRLVLAPRDGELGRELTEVRASRARLVDAFDAERRRIERDLHDGAQQRLVAVTMRLGLARLDAAPDSPAERQLADAQEEIGLAITELRELCRGVHPRALVDHGLGAALENLADRSPVPVALDVELPGRLPPGIESAGYFLVAEALTNVARHSGAAGAEVEARVRADVLTVAVRDDGRGGAAAAEGGGLEGLADRVDAAGGRLRVSSPIGGPTLLQAELPCR